ncbi:hypothetical protein GLYMA_04G172600v4 [Glycine max]|uniref:Uncharacterized protein n=1 Tax=Glycine max TaxID=3847 RepID=K7KKQ6_SOYBN|nr:hypothetical protein GYH30_010241 [Glycine max]KRH63381.1 hypothetical protein GLYMA_04G172600v4 [Glycine max]
MARATETSHSHSFPFTGCGYWCCTITTRYSDPSFPFRSEHVSSLPWLQSTSLRSSRTCRKTHQLLAGQVQGTRNM